MIPTTKIKLIKKDGREFDSIDASVQSKIFIFDVKIPVEKEDIIERIMPRRDY